MIRVELSGRKAAPWLVFDGEVEIASFTTEESARAYGQRRADERALQPLDGCVLEAHGGIVQWVPAPVVWRGGEYLPVGSFSIDTEEPPDA